MSNIIWFVIGAIAGIVAVIVWNKSMEVYDDVVFENEIDLYMEALEKPKRGRPKGSKNKPKLPEQY